MSAFKRASELWGGNSMIQKWCKYLCCGETMNVWNIQNSGDAQNAIDISGGVFLK